MSCQHGNWPPCDECDEIDAAWNRAYAAGKASASKPEAHTMISHEREPHCIGCYVIRWDDGEPSATCNECGQQLSFIDLLVVRRAEPEGVFTQMGIANSPDLDWLHLRDGVVVGTTRPDIDNGRYVRIGSLPSEGGAY